MDIFDIRGEAARARGVERFALVRPSDSAGVHGIGWTTDDRLIGGTWLDVPGPTGATTPLPALADRILEDLRLDEEDPRHSQVADRLPSSLIEAAIDAGAPRRIPHFRPEQIAFLRDVLQDRLGPEGFRALGLRLSSQNDWSLFDHLSTGDRDARRQALEALPAHQVHLAEGGELRALIDARRPLFDWVRRRHGFTAAQARLCLKIESAIGRHFASRIKTATFSEARSSFAALPALDTVVEAAKTISGAALPASDFEVVVMLSAFSEAKPQMRSIGPGSERAYRRALARTPADGWSLTFRRLIASGDREGRLREARDYLDRLGQAIGAAVMVDILRGQPDVDMAAAAQAAAGIWERRPPGAEEIRLLDRILQAVNCPWKERIDLKASVRFAIGEALTLKSLHELQERWHHRAAVMQDRALSCGEPITWTPFAGDVDLGDGLRARELASSTALERQGRLERHCVGGYTASVIRASSEGASLIFSLEDASGILSTAEVVIAMKDGPRKSRAPVFKLAQHLAARNAPPGERATEAARRMMAALRELPNARVTAYLDALARNDGSLRDRMRREIAEWGADIFDPALPERILAIHDEVLPRGLRGLDIAAWRDRIDAKMQHDLTRGLRARLDAHLAAERRRDDASPPAETVSEDAPAAAL